MIKYIFIGLVGITFFVILYMFEITGVIGLFLSIPALFMMTFSAFNLYRRSEYFQSIIDNLTMVGFGVPTDNSNDKKEED